MWLTFGHTLANFSQTLAICFLQNRFRYQRERAPQCLDHRFRRSHIWITYRRSSRKGAASWTASWAASWSASDEIFENEIFPEKRNGSAWYDHTWSDSYMHYRTPMVSWPAKEHLQHLFALPCKLFASSYENCAENENRHWQDHRKECREPFFCVVCR